jgi:hypothetical protein
MNEDHTYLSWRRLRERIDAMPPERLDDPVQLLPPSGHDEPIPLGVVYEMDTIGYYSTCEDGSMVENYTRGVLDNENHPEHYVLLTDHNPHDKDGNTCFELTDDGCIGNKTGKNYGPNPFAKEDDEN